MRHVLAQLARLLESLPAVLARVVIILLQTGAQLFLSLGFVGCEIGRWDLLRRIRREPGLRDVVEKRVDHHRNLAGVRLRVSSDYVAL